MKHSALASDARSRACDVGPYLLQFGRCGIFLALFWPAVGSVAPTHVPTDTVIHVGPTRALTRIADAAKIATDGSTIEVDAGDYVGDVAVWDKVDLTIRSVGGQARLIAHGAAAEGKATWVVRGDRIVIDGFAFTGSRVSDHNGAGIRLEKGSLKITHCLFSDNENGILTGNDIDTALEIESSEFGNNGADDGRTHNIYVGAIRSFHITGSYSHHARSGHLLKSRAQENFILYNRLTDERGGHASYELEFPAGGIAYVIGNIIEQGAETENSVIISVGAEGYRWPKNELYLTHNTLIDDRPANGVFLRVAPGPLRVVAANNLLVGPGKLEAAGAGEYASNFTVKPGQFANIAAYDVRLAKQSDLIAQLMDKAAQLGAPNGFSLRPTREYVHPLQTRAVAAGRAIPGAAQTVQP